MWASFSKRLLASLALVSFARADYYIDDQNFTSLLYSENPGGAKWGPFQEGGETLSITLANGTLWPVDASHCFNYTYTYAACKIADNCQVQIPFTGSGITIYVLQAGAQGINASLTIDGGAPVYNVLPAPPGPNFYIPNVTLFSVQGMATMNHTATMTVLNWDNIFSGMMFDYVLINQTIVGAVSTATTSSATSYAVASTSLPMVTSSPSKSTTNVGAIAAGVVGGLVALIALVFAIFYFCWRRRDTQRRSRNLDVEPKIEPFFAAESLYSQGPHRYTGVTERSTSEGLMSGTVSGQVLPVPHSTSSGSSHRGKAQLGVTNPSTSQIANFGVISPSQAGSSRTNFASSGPSETSRPQIQQTHPMLTDDQADFVNNLYVNNVPAGAIARVIERMIAGERQPAVDVMDGYDSLPPPSYYHGTGGE